MLLSSATTTVNRTKEQPQAETATPVAPASEASRAAGGDGEATAAPDAPRAEPGHGTGKAVFNGFQGPAYPPCLPPDLFD